MLSKRGRVLAVIQRLYFLGQWPLRDRQAGPTDQNRADRAATGQWTLVIKLRTWQPFIQLSRLCFVKLKLLLLAIEVKPDEGSDTKISINPRRSKVPANTIGFFIAQSAEEVKR